MSTITGKRSLLKPVTRQDQREALDAAFDLLHQAHALVNAVTTARQGKPQQDVYATLQIQLAISAVARDLSKEISAS